MRNFSDTAPRCMTGTVPPLLVMLPGLDGTGKLFAKFVQALGSGVDTRIIAYPVDEPLGYEELELRVRAELPADRPFVLLGESFSGPIAIRIAAAAPAGMRGVILCGTFAKSPYPRLRWIGALSFLIPVKALPRWARALVMWGSHAAGAPAQADRAIAVVARSVVRRRLRALLEVDAAGSLGRIGIPALILYGRHDRIVPGAATRFLAAGLPGAQLAPIDGPHLLLQAAPIACAAAVGRWLYAVPPTVSASMRSVGCPTPTGTD